MSDNENLRTMNHRLKNRKDKKFILSSLLDYAQLNNLLLLLLNSTIPNKKDFNNEKDYYHQFQLWFNLSNKVIMKAILKGNHGGEKTKDEIAATLHAFKDNEFLQSAIAHCKEKKINGHNASMLVKRIKKDFKNTFYLIKQGKKASFPRPKKLRNIYKFSLPFESSKFSVKGRKHQRHIGLTFFNKSMRFFFPRKWKLKDEDINSITVGYYHSDIYINVSYQYDENKKKAYQNKLCNNKENVLNNKKENKPKYAGLDIGIKELFGLLIDDYTTKSLLFSGKKFIQKNCSYNKELAKLQESKKHFVTEFKEITQKDGNKVKIPAKYDNESYKYKYIINKIKRIFANRERFFIGEFEKIASNVVKYLTKNQVTHLAISKNLQFLKNEQDKNLKLRKKDQQKFYQIPIGKFLNLLESKCKEVGIIVENINEAYTSKTSVLSQNINDVLQDTSMDKKGYRGVKHKYNQYSKKDRGLFKDKVFNIIYHSDIGAAGNHIKIAFNQSLDYLSNCLHKLCNPICIKSTYEFDSLIK